jgi:ABC-2 type transport system ATP-binding protein
MLLIYSNINFMQIQDRKQEIQWLIASDNADLAVKRTMDFVKDFSNDAQHVQRIMDVHHQFAHIETPLSAEERRKNLFQILRLLDDVEGNHVQRALNPTDSTLAIRLNGIHKSFKSNNFHLKDIHAIFKTGEITGIVGPNANGKSTLLRIIAGELSADTGKMDFTLFQQNSDRLGWETIKHFVSYVPQELQPWQGTLKDNLRYVAALHGICGADNEREVNFIIARLGLTRYAEAQWSHLSGGYKLRFALAKALIWKPAILILDEPLANLDINAQTLVLNDLKDLAHSFANPICLLISSQHIHEIENISDNIIVLEEGTIKYNGKRADFGIGNNYYMFELTTPVNPAILEQAVATLPNAELKSHGYYYTIKTPTTIPSGMVLNHLHQQEIAVDYFRDISRSVKQMFL